MTRSVLVARRNSEHLPLPQDRWPSHFPTPATPFHFTENRSEYLLKSDLLHIFQGRFNWCSGIIMGHVNFKDKHTTVIIIDY